MLSSAGSAPRGGGTPVSQLVQALLYKVGGRGFDSWWCNWKYFCHNPSGRNMALGSTQTLTEMSTRNISWGWRRPVHTADNLITFMCRLSKYLGASTPWNPVGLQQVCNGIAFFLQLQTAVLGRDLNHLLRQIKQQHTRYRSTPQLLLHNTPTRARARAHTHTHTHTYKHTCIYFFFQALNFLVESFGLLNDLFPFPSILDAGYPFF